MWTDALTFAAILLARTIPLVELTPFLGHRAVPRTVRLAFALGLAVLVAPIVVDASLLAARPSGMALVLILVHEVLVGLLLGFLGSLVFEAARMAGGLVDEAARLRKGRCFERGYGLLAIVLFFLIGGHHLWLAAATRSYVAFSPMSRPLLPEALGLEIARASADAIELAVLLALPVFAVVLLVELTAGVLHFAAPRIGRVLTDGPLRGLAVIGVVALGLGVLGDELATALPEAMHRLSEFGDVR